MGVIRKKTVNRGGEGGVKYHCDVCSVDITSTVRIRCAHSACPDYDLCVSCFAKGSSSGNHKPETHPYRVIEQNSFPIFDPDWGADEELLLLEGAEIYGLGSWADIADHIGGFRDKDEVRDHYLKTYVESSRFPLPERCSPHDMELANQISREDFQAKKKRRIEERKEAAKNAPALQPKTKPTASVPSCHEVQGYMPGRLEFETEYANEAEEAVQLMQFEPGDGLNPRTGELEPETELKLVTMDIYNARLTQRAERKKVMFEHNLLEYRENTKQEKKRTKEERDMVNKTKPFARLMNHTDYENFVQGLLDEINLRQAIAQLQEWRQMGIGDLRSGEKYEQDKAQRAQKNIPMGSLDRLASAQRGSKAAAAPEPQSGASLLVAPELPEQLAPFTNSPYGVDPDGNSVSVPRLKTEANGTNKTSEANGTNGTHGTHGTNGTTHASAKRPFFMPAPIPGINPLQHNPGTPDLQLIAPHELKLCEVIRLQPKAYILIKAEVMKEAIRGNGYLKKKQVKDICRLDPQKGSRIFECFVNWGWIGKA
ncbi:transcriptional adapter 2 [Sodiomyces alkalinus F11]|uniref:Transcriptional adapter 2 n=1 Tax=Sodiomyces alkalinus (strain CBS 110278 / VKM F-3762 / F11) TaxID=1314773 RepID=A0A3N2Q630_SODAK|nr:transcriptional adapter 2 [Sodiomyces alkalinus F11]ROT42239.1 transcriptional adapter 2 [Sodiomyces alkalinus F11]